MKSTPPSRLAARVSSLLLLAALLFVAPASAYAQCAPQLDTAEALEQAQAVFVASVRSLDPSGRVAQMEVLSVWKGRDLPSRVEVRGATSSDAPTTATDGRFSQGATYLVIPENGREPFLATSCSATQPYTNPPNLIPPIYQDAIGADTGRIPATAPTLTAEEEEALLASSIVPLIGIIGLIALSWIGIAWVRSTKPERLEEASAEPEPTTPKPRPKKMKRRNFHRDAAGAEHATSRTLRRNNRGFKWYRRRQERQLAAARKARGSTDTS